MEMAPNEFFPPPIMSMRIIDPGWAKRFPLAEIRHRGPA
jgi:hypothetical protein